MPALVIVAVLDLDALSARVAPADLDDGKTTLVNWDTGPVG